MLQDLKRLVGSAWRLSRGRIVLQVALMLITGVVGGANLLLLVPIVESVTGDGGTITAPVVGEVSIGSVPLPLLLGAFIAFTVLTALLGRAAALNSSRLQAEVVDSIRVDAFSAILAADWPFLLRRRRSDVVSTVTVGAGRAGTTINQVMSLGVSVTMFLATSAVTLFLSPLVGGVALLGVLALAALQATVIRPSYRLGGLLTARSKQLQASITDTMDSLRLVKAHDASGAWHSDLVASFTGAREVQIEQVRRSSRISAISSIAMAVAASALVLVGVTAGIDGAVLIVILLLVARMSGQARGIVNSITQLANGLPAVRDLVDLTQEAREAVEIPPQAVSSRRNRDLADHPVLVEFDRVRFHYEGSEQGVQDLSFTVPRGRITALTGPSGSGKSTSADLALGLLKPQSGQVLVAGEPLVAADYRWWRQHIAYVPQETLIVPGTLRHNLTWSLRESATDEECWDALRRAAASFALQLPEGLDTLLGDRGVRLSGGERQRVAIARALLRQPAFLVLDEATSALDDEREAHVLDEMTDLGPDVTLLIIAHRQSTVQLADHVVTLRDGTVTDSAAVVRLDHSAESLT